MDLDFSHPVKKSSRIRATTLSVVFVAIALSSGVVGCFSGRTYTYASSLRADVGNQPRDLPGNRWRDPNSPFFGALEIRAERASPNGVATAVYEHPVPEITSDGFCRAIVSWNISTPPGTGAWFEVRAWRSKDGHSWSGSTGDAGWSPWLFIGEWGEVSPEQAGWPIQTKAADASIEVDEFVSSERWDLLQWRVVVASTTPGRSVTVHNVIISANLESPNADSRNDKRADQLPTPADLPVPFRSQKTDNPALAGRLCSPTSVSMVLGLHHHNVSVQRVAELAYDRRHDIYGNWPRNVQAAFELGLSGAVVRFANWNEVSQQIEKNRAVIISFAADKGELPAAPYESTSGHLIVIRGFDERGDVLVNDPACGTEQEGRRTYSRDDLTRVWLRKGRGTAYLLWPRDDSTPLRVRELAAPATTEPTK